MEQNNVNFHIKKQSKYPHVPPTAEQKCKYFHTAMADRYVSPALNIFFFSQLVKWFCVLVTVPLKSVTPHGLLSFLTKIGIVLKENYT